MTILSFDEISLTNLLDIERKNQKVVGFHKFCQVVMAKNFLNGKNNIEIFLWKENYQIRIYYIDWIIGRKFVDFENFSIARSRNYSTETCSNWPRTQRSFAWHAYIAFIWLLISIIYNINNIFTAIFPYFSILVSACFFFYIHNICFLLSLPADSHYRHTYFCAWEKFAHLMRFVFSKRKLCNGENFQIKGFDEFRCFWGSWVRIIGF